MSRSRRAPLPVLNRLYWRADKSARLRFACNCGAEHPGELGPRVLTLLVWLGSLALAAAFGFGVVGQLGAALAVVLPAAPRPERCRVCQHNGSMLDALAKLRYVQTDRRCVVVWMCGRHRDDAKALQAYLRRRERAERHAEVSH